MNIESLNEPPVLNEGTLIADEAWQSLDDRSREVLRLRSAGHTLDEVGKAIGGLTREWARQLQMAAEKQFAAHLAEILPELKARLAAVTGERCAITDDDLVDIVRATDQTARAVALHLLGLTPVRFGPFIFTGWWAATPDIVRLRVDDLANQAPFLAEELPLRAAGLNLPAGVDGLLEFQGSRLLCVQGLGWVRRARKARDTAFLWLTTQGEPRAAGEIAEVAGLSENGIRETMRRDPAFALVRPEGTWALTQWNAHSTATAYTTAADVVVDVLRERGPMNLQELFAEAGRLYPVGSWRYSQTLSDSRVGRTTSGLYDLAERGATPIEDAEPRKPQNMAESTNGRIIAVKIPVNYDLLRGSGINVNRWLTWRLGLRTAPTARRFELLDPPGEVTVRRNTSTASVSSLRAAVHEMGLVDGCQLVLILRPGTNSASLRHGCTDSSCLAQHL